MQNQVFVGKFWDKWHCLLVWFYCLGAPFFQIGQTKRIKKQKFSKLLWQKEASTFSLTCYFQCPFFVSLIILYWLSQQENGLMNRDKHKQICRKPKYFVFRLLFLSLFYNCCNLSLNFWMVLLLTWSFPWNIRIPLHCKLA